MVPDRESDPPPAGGFGEAAAGKRFGPFQPAPEPPQSLPQRALHGVLSFLGVTALVLLGLGALTALFVAIKYAKVKTADVRRTESVNTLGYIAKRASETYAERGSLCPSAQPSDPEWSCLGVEMTSLTRPQAYRYDYRSDGNAFTATATPIDGKDAIVREIRGVVVEGKLVLDTSIRER